MGWGVFCCPCGSGAVIARIAGVASSRHFTLNYFSFLRLSPPCARAPAKLQARWGGTIESMCQFLGRIASKKNCSAHHRVKRRHRVVGLRRKCTCLRRLGPSTAAARRLETVSLPRLAVLAGRGTLTLHAQVRCGAGALRPPRGLGRGAGRQLPRPVRAGAGRGARPGAGQSFGEPLLCNTVSNDGLSSPHMASLPPSVHATPQDA